MGLCCGPVAPAASAVDEPAQVEVLRGWAIVGTGSAELLLRYRCDPSLEADGGGVSVDVRQDVGDYDWYWPHSGLGAYGVTCDGRWHRAVVAGECVYSPLLRPGPALVSVLLVDENGETLQMQDLGLVRLRAA